MTHPFCWDRIIRIPWLTTETRKSTHPLQKRSVKILEWPLLPGSLQLVCANIWLCWDTCLKERRGGEVKCLYQRNRMLTTFQTTASKSIGMTIMGNEEIYISYSRDKNQATSHEISHDREFLLLWAICLYSLGTDSTPTLPLPQTDNALQGEVLL